MAFSMAGGGPFRAQMNVTPLIDVLLVLIIVFMVVQSMSKEKGVQAQIPQQAQKDSATPELDRTIVIQVLWDKKDGKALLKINQQEVRWDQLEARLQDIYKQRAERVAFVSGDNDLDFQYVADVIAMAHDAGVDRVGLLTAENHGPGS